MAGRQGRMVEITLGTVWILAIASLAVTAIVFVLGMSVGQRIAQSRYAETERVVRLPAPREGVPVGDGEVDVTFWDNLEPGATPRRGIVTPPPTEAPEAIRIEPTRAPTLRPKPTAAPRAPEPTRAPPPTVKPPSAGVERYQVQLTASADRDRALRVARDLRARGFVADVSEAIVQRRTLYRVRVGRYATEEEGRAAVEQFRKSGYPNSFLVSE